MFRDKYRADNQKIEPDDALLKYLSVRMSDAAAEQQEPPVVRTPHKSRLFRGVAALAACLALIVSAGGLYIVFDDKKQEPDVTPEEITKVKTGISYTELYKLVKSMEPEKESGFGFFDGAQSNGVINEDANGFETEGKRLRTAPAQVGSNADSAAREDYSKTNTQVGGVDEADIIKTDGNFIYTLSNGRLIIVSVDGREMKKVSTIDCTKYADKKDGSRPVEMYVNGDRLVVIKDVIDERKTDAGFAPEIDVYRDMMRYSTHTSMAVYDIKDRSDPKLLSDLGQSGGYLSSRMVGKTLYLITNHYINETADKDKPETFVPMLYNNGKGRVVEAGDITVSVKPEGRQYIVVTAVDIGNPTERLSSKSVFGCGSTIYASTENILIASGSQKVTTEGAPLVTTIPESEEKVEPDSGAQSADYSPAAKPRLDSINSGENAVLSELGNPLEGRKITYSSVTNLMRFSLNNGKIELAATGSIPGSLLNQFSMDEYKGYFRFVTTRNDYTEYTSGSGNQATVSVSGGDTSNSLYVLNSKMEIVGRIEDVAKGERVYSVRFSGDIGYFVTFRQVDPLFTVDLTNPASPKILSALKIPGFSEYLHPYSDGLLFGLGKNADENGRVNGLKLSMFDVSDPADVTEKHKLILSEYWSEASYNHKAIIVSPQRELIAFPADNKYVIYSYDKNDGFSKSAEFFIGENDYNLRGIYIGSVFYVCSQTSIRSYSMDDYTKIAMIEYYTNLK
ncbi:MAG: beta-propeller domain-containing protein [Oscillospiraceae bacterium]|nr:beta-propeller domain-containing protein [Oscillospiraceae bacterium]